MVDLFVERNSLFGRNQFNFRLCKKYEQGFIVIKKKYEVRAGVSKQFFLWSEVISFRDLAAAKPST